MSLHIKLTFNKSRSKDFATVLKHCRYFDHFWETPGHKLEIVSLEELYQKWESFNLVYYYTRKWAGTSFSYNGTEYRKNDMFYTIQDLKRCYKEYREDHNDRQEFCDTFEWGCSRLKSVSKEINHSFGPFWYDYGYFVDENRWRVDKDRIREVLMDEAKKTCAVDCPLFNEGLMNYCLFNIPDEIFIDGVKWKKTYKQEWKDGQMINVAIGIVHDMEQMYSREDEPEFETYYPGDLEIPENLNSNEADEIIKNWEKRNR